MTIDSLLSGLIGAILGFLATLIAVCVSERYNRKRELNKKKAEVYVEAISQLNNLIQGNDIHKTLPYFQICDIKFGLFGTHKAFDLYRKAFMPLYKRYYDLDYYCPGGLGDSQMPPVGEDVNGAKAGLKEFLRLVKKELGLPDLSV